MNRHACAVLCSIVILFGAGTGALAAADKFNLKPGARGKTCLTCHVAFQEKLKDPSLHTPVKRGECSACHNPHTSSHSKLLDADANKVCQTCHAKLVPEQAASVHAVVAQGQCVACHDPHGSKYKNNLKIAGSALCFGCHKEMGAALPALKHHHPPVDKDCLNCHTPHASAGNVKLLKDKVTALCVRCHKTDKPIFAKQHMNYPVAASRCTSCHDPHGSDRSGILYNTVHQPVAAKMCNQCHEDPGSPNALKTKKAGFELCKACHSAMVRESFEKTRLHWPVAGKNGCEGCHSPHAAKEKGLLREKTATLCGSCHSDTVQRSSAVKTKHRPVADGQCTLCHSPHASNNAFFLVQAQLPDLCGQCHDWKKHQTHPLGDQIRDPRNKNLSVDCSSCHYAHGTDFKRILPYATITETCVQCHEKYRR